MNLNEKAASDDSIVANDSNICNWKSIHCLEMW